MAHTAAQSSESPPRIWGALLAILLLRLVFAATVPLVPDEAYYWTWSRQLAGGYFDHPPMIAWLIAGGTALVGDTPLGVRLLPNVAGTVATAAIAWTADRLAGPRAAQFALLAFAAMPIAAVGMVLATPDAPLLMGIAWTLCGVVQALSHPPGSGPATRWWLGAGVAIGIAMASKFTGILIPMGLTLTMLVVPTLRPRLREAGPWLAVGVASLVMVPVLLWNASHDWIAFRFQLGHGLGGGAKESLLARQLSLVGGQVALASPILFGLLLAAILAPMRAQVTRRAVRTDADTAEALVGTVRDPRRLALAGVALFCLAFFVFSATRKRVEANWPAIAWVPGMILLAARVPGMRSRWERRGVQLATALSVLLLAHVVRPVVELPGSRDPVNQAHGWEALATALAVPPQTPVAANRYQDAAMLAFHFPGQPTVTALNLGSRPNQFDLWPRFAETAQPGDSLVLVLGVPRDGEIPPPIAALLDHFETVRAGAVIPLRRDGREIGRRQGWMLTGWRGTWPATAAIP
jgi:4-amino-4-deoxy-L-arabinose transferase-like glycosyltransferase